MVANADHDALAQLEFDLLRPAARARHELVMARHALAGFGPWWPNSI
jgi:hypothetical protein